MSGGVQTAVGAVALALAALGCSQPQPSPLKTTPAREAPATTATDEPRFSIPGVPEEEVTALDLGSERALVVEHGPVRVRLVLDGDRVPSGAEAVSELIARVDAGEPVFADERPLATLDTATPRWLLPPSARPRTGIRGTVTQTRFPRPNAESDRPGLAFASGLLSEETVLGLIALDDGETGGLLCLRTTARTECTDTRLTSLQSATTRATDTLLLGHGTKHGRGGEARLVVITLGPTGLEHDHILIGEIDGYGEACEEHEGYCVYLHGGGHTWRRLADDCIERRPGARWGARHVRVGDRWVDETLHTAPECVETYRIAEGRFVREACGPTSSARRCTAADFEVVAP